MSEIVNLKVDRELLGEIERIVPRPYRGEKLASKSVDYALRDYLRLKSAEQQKPTSPAEAST